MTIRIMIVEDHAMVRQGLQLQLTSQEDMKIVAEAESVEGAIAQLEATKPDVLILDLALPDGSGLEVLKAAQNCSPQTRTIVVTGTDDPTYLRNVLWAGACGYLVKFVETKQLLAGVRAVHAGQTFVVTSMTDNFAATVCGGTQADSETSTRLDQSDEANLSQREKLVLSLVARGHTSEQIGEKLFLSTKTIDTYRSRAARKLGIRDRSQLVQYAIDAGLMDLVPDSP